MNRRQKQTLIAVAVVAVIGWARWDGRPNLMHEAANVAPQVTVSATPTPTVQPAPAPLKVAPPDVDAAPLTDIARAAVAAWQAPTVEERQARLAPITTPAYLTAAATIDPADVPAAPVATTAAEVADDGPATVTVTLTDGTRLVVDIVNPDGWPLVNDIRPA